MTPDEILERTQWDLFWVPDDVTIVDRPELLYVSCDHDVPYLNVATRTRAGAQRLPGLVAEVSSAHRSVRSRWLVCPQNRGPDLERALGDGGYAPAYETVGYVRDLSSFGAPDPRIVVQRVESVPALRDSVAVADEAFGFERDPSDGELRRDLAACADPAGRVHRFLACDAATGEPMSVGGMTAFPELGFGFLWGGGTVTAHRGRGAYGQVLRARLEHARRLGLATVGLYARVDTSAPIVEARGFTACGPMTYWDRPPPAME